jgi:hypothetical protein
MWRAATFFLTDREAPVVALVGFLIRGGIVLIALPSVVLPSVIGIAGATGVDYISISGEPTQWLVEVVLGASVAAVVWLTVAGLVGSLVDVWLVDMALDARRPATRGRLPLPRMALLVRLLAIRMICLVPLAIALVWAAGQIFSATYDELTTPTNLATPLPLRVIFAATSAVTVVAAAWLVAETIAAIAIRRQILAGHGIWRSLGGAAWQLVRRPVSTLLTVFISYATSVVAVGLALVATATAFDWCRIAARNTEPIAVKLGIGDFSTTRDFRPVAFALAAVAVALAWAAALVLSGVASAWRSAAFTHEVADALPAAAPDALPAAAVVPATGGAPDRNGLGLPGLSGERSQE